ncbi:MAG: hypothetical protein QOJ75_1654 [Chloroflexota bacterium]|nr:hypothetical protein [Chloroflexota bacterium]
MEAAQISGEVGARTTTPRIAVILRDIARSGVAGLLTGLLVAGIGGRLVMRAAALLEPSATGRLTENGNLIGEITIGGSFALLFAGVFFGLAGAVVWVVVSPWLPERPRARALVAAPVAVALSAVGLIDGFNPDFSVLQHDVTTVLLLLVLVAIAGVVISVFDHWLDGRLPTAGASPRSDSTYLVLSVAGAGLILPVVLGGYLGGETPLGLALVVCGLATLLRWRYRYRGGVQPSWLMPIGRAALVAAVVLGTIAVVPDVSLAMGVAGGAR